MAPRCGEGGGLYGRCGREHSQRHLEGPLREKRGGDRREERASGPREERRSRSEQRAWATMAVYVGIRSWGRGWRGLGQGAGEKC